MSSLIVTCSRFNRFPTVNSNYPSSVLVKPSADTIASAEMSALVTPCFPVYASRRFQSPVSRLARLSYTSKHIINSPSHRPRVVATGDNTGESKKFWTATATVIKADGSLRIL